MGKGKATHEGSVMVTGSKFEKNGYDGLYLGDPRFKVTLLRCHVAENQRHGICVRGTKFEMQDTSVEANGQEPVHTEEFKAKMKSTGSEHKAREVNGADLPDGWRAFKTEDGLVYYYQTETGRTQWTHPSETEAVPQQGTLRWQSPLAE